MLDVDGPATVSHIWFTIADGEPYCLKRIVLRAYRDGEFSPSVESPIGDFFGLGLGEYHSRQSQMLSVGNAIALNCFFPMPFAHLARITITNEGQGDVEAIYYNMDYPAYAHSLAPETLYFHAQYHQAQPNHGWLANWQPDDDYQQNGKSNLDGKDNYFLLEAQGHEQFVGVTMSTLQNQDLWWGEGDDMFIIDGKAAPSIVGTGSADYFFGGMGHHFRTPCTVRRWWDRNPPEAGLRSTDFIHIHRFPSPSRLRRQSNTVMPICVRITTIQLLTGIRMSRTRNFPAFRRSRNGHPWCNRSGALAILPRVGREIVLWAAASNACRSW